MLLALSALALMAPATSLAEPTAPLGHSGRWITDAKGRVVILHGVNMVYKRPPYFPAATGFDEEDAAFLEHNGFNTVRLGVIYAGVEPSPGTYDEGYLNQIASTESMLARHGIFSQIDFHQDMYNERYQGEGWPDWAVQDDGLPNVPLAGFPNNYFSNGALIRAFDNFWANVPGPGGVGLQDRYAAAFGRVAQRFAQSRHTLGFDLLNEPWPGSAFVSCFVPVGCPVFDGQSLAPFYSRVISRIRAAEPQKLVWYEPNVIFNFGADTRLPSPGDGAAGLSFHVYCATGQLALPGLGSLTCPQLDELVFQNAERRSQATGDALLLSEFGAVDDLDRIGLNVREADEHMVSWQYWHYCECLDPTTSGPGIQAVVVDPSQPPTGANVKQAKLDALARPYPQLIAGTPSGYGFDEATRRFHLAYSTRGPAGKRFKTRRVKGKKRVVRRKSPETEIFVGGGHYPGGYRAVAKGGGIASKPGKRVLRVIACPGRSQVDVTVTPMSGKSKNKGDCRVQKKKRKPRRKG